jgi:hypothetical protein
MVQRRTTMLWHWNLVRTRGSSQIPYSVAHSKAVQKGIILDLHISHAWHMWGMSVWNVWRQCGKVWPWHGPNPGFSIVHALFMRYLGPESYLRRLFVLRHWVTHRFCYTTYAFNKTLHMKKRDLIPALLRSDAVESDDQHEALIHW